jgi:3-phosphoshikimate 1-carboxyvinyltransferase
VKLIVEPSRLKGDVRVPASKSHTIRALIIATLAEGVSEISDPLDSLDTRAAVDACRALGAKITADDVWRVHGVGGDLTPPEDIIDVANSGTTLYFIMSAAALVSGAAILTGDASIRTRPADPLLSALEDLGAEAFSTRGNGCAPFVVRGPMKGGKTKVAAISSQYLSSLLISCPLARGTTEIDVVKLNEAPYVRMTLDWLNRRGIKYEADELTHFRIPGGQAYHGFKRAMPADFSSATFFLVAAAVTDSDVQLLGLDMDDAQGDKEVVRMLEAMGAAVVRAPEQIRICRGELNGGEFDLNATPDALPAMAVAGCLAEGETRLVNVAQARLKETDRIAVMAEELTKMGADITPRDDGLILRGCELTGAHVNGHDDHRVVMALAVAGLAAEGTTVIDTAESVAVTFPGFVDLMTALGATMHTED